MESMERRVQVLLRNLRVYSRRTRVQVLAGQHNCKAVNCSQSWSAVEACCVHMFRVQYRHTLVQVQVPPQQHPQDAVNDARLWDQRWG